MNPKIIAALIGAPIILLVAVFGWGALRGPTHLNAAIDQTQPTATLSEQLSEGLLETQVFALGNLNYRIEIQFSPEATSTSLTGVPPVVILSMAKMEMEGFQPPLELVGAGAWRSVGQLPMAGDWIMNVGYGDDFIEVPFKNQ